VIFRINEKGLEKPGVKRKVRASNKQVPSKLKRNIGKVERMLKSPVKSLKNK